MSILSAFGMMGLVLLGITLLCFGAIWVEKNFPTEKYDERQQLVRGRAFRLAFLVGNVYLLLILPLLIGQVDREKTVEPYLLVFGGFMLQELVFHIYCLINHAALPLSSRPVAMISCYLIVGLLWLAPYRNLLRWGGPSLVGYGTSGIFFLMMSFYWITMAIMQLIQLIRVLRREKE